MCFIAKKKKKELRNYCVALVTTQLLLLLLWHNHEEILFVNDSECTRRIQSFAKNLVCLPGCSTWFACRHFEHTPIQYNKKLYEGFFAILFYEDVMMKEDLYTSWIVSIVNICIRTARNCSTNSLCCPK